MLSASTSTGTARTTSRWSNVKLHFWGGPAHCEVMEFEGNTVTPRCTLVVSGSEESEKANIALAQMGISPPVGTFMAHYILFTTYDEDALYIFLYTTGDLPPQD